MQTPKTPLAPRLRRALVIAAVGLLAGVSACDDPFAVTASQSNADVTFEVWAMSGSPAAFPAGLLLVPSPTAVRLDAAGSFDLALDIDENGRVVVYPMGKVVAPVLGSRAVDLQRGVGPYNTIIEAPRDGWLSDTVLVVNEGQSFLAKVSTQYCQGYALQYIMAKFVIDSVIPAERRIKVSSRINPNCGFRSLLSGVPEF